MRFVNAIVGIVLFGVVSLVLVNGLCTCRSLDARYFELSSIKSSEEFIAESFRQTCKGECFFDLNEWQITCRNMFNLEYIAWSNANEFMDVSMNNSNEELFYGVWKQNGEIKEVYCRKKRS